MASRTPSCLARQVSRLSLAQDTLVTRNFARALATEAQTPESHDLLTTQSELIHPWQHTPPANPFLQTAHCTTHSFPSLEPVGFVSYPSTHLLLPLRRDILHRAVTYEADATRRGTASTKWRSEVHGSTKKVRPQKGSGKARLGDKKSPSIRGGGVAFGPKPRDFSTDLPRAYYDLAWRTALSYRYRRGQLIVLDAKADLLDVDAGSRVRYLSEMFKWNHIGKGDGRTLLVTHRRRPQLEEAFDEFELQKNGQLADVADVDVKDLLKLGRVMIEQKALDEIFAKHQTDLGPEQKLQWWREHTGAAAKEPSPMVITSSVRSS